VLRRSNSGFGLAVDERERSGGGNGVNEARRSRATAIFTISLVTSHAQGRETGVVERGRDDR